MTKHFYHSLPSASLPVPNVASSPASRALPRVPPAAASLILGPFLQPGGGVRMGSTAGTLEAEGEAAPSAGSSSPSAPQSGFPLHREMGAEGCDGSLRRCSHVAPDCGAEPLGPRSRSPLGRILQRGC